MKLVELRIKNFRGLGGDENVINFRDSNIIFLIGQNNVGKSSFLKAYSFFTDSRQKASLQDFFNHDLNIPIEIEGDFILEEQDNENEDFSSEPNWVSNWVQVDSQIITVKKVWNEVEKSFKKYTKKPNGEWQINGFGGLDTLFQKYTPTPILVNALDTEKDLEDRVNKLIETEYLKKLHIEFSNQYSTVLNSIKLLQECISSASGVTTYNSRINTYFKQIFPNLTLEISSKGDDEIDVIKAFKTNHSINIKKNGVDRKELFSSHGHGVIRQAFFNFLAFLKNENSSNRKEYLLLFEEPEIFLHPKSEQLLREQLYELSSNSPFQVLCATHSPQMIDISKPHCSLVRVVKDEVTELTKTHQVGHSIFQNEVNLEFVQLINRFNPNVCEVFYTSKVIVVEGDTEAVIIREILKRNHPNADFFVLNSGSKNNIPFYLRILNHFKINYFVIHDSDTRHIYEDKERTRVKRNNDGTCKRNSAWSFNSQIQNEINNGIEFGIYAKRFVSIFDFEYLNNYTYNPDKGKPLSAYEFILENRDNQELPIVSLISRVVNDDYGEIWDDETLEASVIEPVLE